MEAPSFDCHESRYALLKLITPFDTEEMKDRLLVYNL
jgi:hypothetical protein